jgi:uncharacterized protein YecE (DUF72 family)
MTKSVRIGAVDWRDPAWTGPFYPSDMPDEWRLSYYSSQYNCVFLKASTWRQATSTEFAQWCDDVHEQFVFLLEDDENSTPPEAPVHKAILVKPTDPRILWIDRNSDLKKLAADINAWEDGKDLYLISRDGDPAWMERLATLLELMGL